MFTDGNITPYETEKIYSLINNEEGSLKIFAGKNFIDKVLSLDGLKNIYLMLYPVQLRNGMKTVFIFLNDKPFDVNEDEKCVFKITSRYFVGLLNELELENKIETLKERAEKEIAERTLRIGESLRQLKEMQDHLLVGIFLVDKKNGLIADVNLMAQKIIGLPKEEIIYRKRSDFFLFEESLESFHDLHIDTEGLLQTGDGRIISIIRKTSEVEMNGGAYLLDNFIDISDRKLMEQELQRAHDDLEKRVEERTKQLSKTNLELHNQIKERIKSEEERMKLYWAVHQSPTMIIITNIQGEIEYVNPSFVNITGYTLEEVIGKNPRFLKSGEVPASKYEKLWKTITSGNDWKYEFRNKKKNGERYWVATTISPVKTQDGKITNFLAVQEDITERKSAEGELIIAKDRAETSAQFKTKLLANLSHEFRTPLISIIGFTDFLKDDLKNEDHIDLVKEINLSGKRLLNTLSSVLLLSQLESFDENIKMIPIDVSEKIEELLPQHIMAANMKKLKLNFIKHESPVIVLIEEVMFKQMLDNIIDNAIKYTNYGSVTISTSIERKRRCVIKIEDTGIGISDEEKEYIFEAFRQASEGYSRNYDGCGLGLTLAKKIAETMFGDITVESTPSVGSAFIIKLPLYRN
jgi:PAS domain S-box-containing protein